MKDLIKNFGLLVMALLILFLIYKWQMAKIENNTYVENIKGNTDTIFVLKYLQPEKEYVNIIKPEKVYIYKTDTMKLDSIVIHERIVNTYIKDSMYSSFNIGYLTNFPNSEKLIQLNLTQKELGLSLVALDGQVINKKYPLNLVNYKYLYTDGNMTYKKKFNLSLSAAYYIRPMLNLHDINIDLSVKTNKINYIGGVNIFYYPKYNQTIGITPILGIKYNF